MQNADLRNVAQNASVAVLGAVVTRQRPATASGVVFITLEDETGAANLIVWKRTFEKAERHIEELSFLFDSLGEGDSAINMTRRSADDAKRQGADSRRPSRYAGDAPPAHRAGLCVKIPPFKERAFRSLPLACNRAPALFRFAFD